MLNQEIVTFSGDTATAKLDIQIGRGPFAPAADGLVKIGETMTLVVSVEGDPGFDLQVCGHFFYYLVSRPHSDSWNKIIYQHDGGVNNATVDITCCNNTTEINLASISN
jgi:hypothetical protein